MLYIFYNSNLVEGPINRTRGSIGFIDDFNAWVIGPDEETNTQTLQTTVIPHTERWARESGAIFEADKTGFIHFRSIRRPAPAEQATTTPLRFGSATVTPQTAIKVLGVTLDSHLQMNTHLAKVAAKGLSRCLTLHAVKGLRPMQIRQLYRACVVPITDYTASTWYGPGKHGTAKHILLLEKVQRLGARIILRAFKSVSLAVLEAEAGLATVADRLHAQVSNHAAKLLALPGDHPARQAVLPRKNVSKTYASPIWQTIRHHEARLLPASEERTVAQPA